MTQVLTELQEYASEVDVDFVRKAVRAIGRLAIKISSAADKCIAVLLELVSTKINYVVQEAVVVIKDVFRRYPNQYEGIIATLCEHLDALDSPEAKAAIIWIIGQYADRIDNSDELLEDFLENFLEEPAEVSLYDHSLDNYRFSCSTYHQVQLALLTATVKLFIKRPTVGQDLVPKVLKWATEEVDNPDLRDRGFIYWRLLSTDPVAAKDVVLPDMPAINTEAETMDRTVLDRLLLHTGSLASVYHQAPETFIRNQKPRRLQDSSALTSEARSSMNASNPLIIAPPPTPLRSTTATGGVPPLPPKRMDSTMSEYGNGNLIGESDLLDPASPAEQTQFASSVSPTGDPYADLEGALGRSPMYPGEEEESQGVSPLQIAKPICVSCAD